MCAQQTLEGQCYREVRQIVAATAPRRSSAAIRRCCAASAATTSTRSSGPTAPFNLAKLMVGSEGTLGVVVEAKLALVPLPKAKAVLAIQFADLLEALAATPAILAHAPSAIEVMDRFILDHTRQSPALERLRSTFIEGRSGGAALRRDVFGDCRRSAAAPRRARARSVRARIRLPLSPRARSGGAERDLVGARSGARPLDGDEGRRQVAVVRRGHRGGARAAARLHRALSRHGTEPWHDGGRLCACLGRLPARAAGRESEDRSRGSAVRSDRLGQRRSGARVRRRAVGRARRRSGPQPVHGEDVRAGAVRRVPARSSGRSIRTASSTPGRSSTRRR